MSCAFCLLWFKLKKYFPYIVNGGFFSIHPFSKVCSWCFLHCFVKQDLWYFLKVDLEGTIFWSDYDGIRRNLLGSKQSSVLAIPCMWESTLWLVTKGLVLEIDFPADQFWKDLWIEEEIKWGIIIKRMFRGWTGVLLNHLGGLCTTYFQATAAWCHLAQQRFAKLYNICFHPWIRFCPLVHMIKMAFISLV